jgi:DNA-binding transcriptional ArsR family regulator
MTWAERPGPQGGQGLLYLTDEQLRRGIEAMFFAYRGFTADPDRILEERDYGRAHHRALHFIHARPGTTVGNLLDILGVTKQSLNRVLRRLMEDGLVEARVGARTGASATSTSPTRAAPWRRPVGRPARPDARRLPRRGAPGRPGLPPGARGDDGP